MDLQFDESEVDEPGLVFFIIGMMFVSVGAALYTTTSEFIGLIFSLLAIIFVLSGLYYRFSKNGVEDGQR